MHITTRRLYILSRVIAVFKQPVDKYEIPKTARDNKMIDVYTFT